MGPVGSESSQQMRSAKIWFTNMTRAEVQELNKIWKKLGIEPLPIPSKAPHYYSHW
jgi:hypothetical protein